jgi:hypothetical protein
MKELRNTFTGIGEVRDFKFDQLEATPKAYLYKVDVFGQIHYEVFKRRENTRHGNVSYPTSKAFGVWAQATRDYCKALAYYKKYNEGGGSHE